MEDLLEGEEKALFADKAYDQEALKKAWRKEGRFYGILAKGRRNRPLSSKQKKRNRKFSRIKTNWKGCEKRHKT